MPQLENLSDIYTGFYKTKDGVLTHIQNFHGGFKAKYSSNRRDQILSGETLQQNQFSKVFLDEYTPTSKEQKFIENIQAQRKAKNPKRTISNFSITPPHIHR